MEELRKELADLVNRAKATRHAIDGVQAASSLAAMDIAETLADLGQRFHILSVRLKQAGKDEAWRDANERNRPRQPKRNAAQAAADMRRRGCYSVQP